MPSRRIRSFALALLLLGAAAIAHACSIPVFRYALERWDLARHEVLVFHKEPLPAEADAWLKKLERGEPAANLNVRRLDVAKLPKEYEKLWKKNARELPCILVRSTDPEAPQVLWAGPVDEAKLKAVVDSPMRHTIVDRLKRGDTATFVVLTSDDAEADAETQKMLDATLDHLAKSLELPAQTEEGPQLKTGLPLKIAFSTRKLRRDDPDEAAFVHMLLATEEDLDKVKGPIVMPVFGKGRLLCTLYGKDLNPTQVTNVVRFLCGECTCQIKELNPGIDLLIAADWADLLEKAGPPAVKRPDTPPAFRQKDKEK
jgi:hypothetical protein